MGELARWGPTLKPIKFHGDKATREELIRTRLEPGQRDEDRDWHVCVTTYEVCTIEKNVLNKFAWSYLIIDEGMFIFILESTSMRIVWPKSLTSCFYFRFIFNRHSHLPLEAHRLKNEASTFSQTVRQFETRYRVLLTG